MNRKAELSIIALVVVLIVLAFVFGQPIAQSRESDIESTARSFIEDFASNDAKFQNRFSKLAVAGETIGFLPDARDCVRTLGKLLSSKAANFSHASAAATEDTSNVFLIHAEYDRNPATYRLEYIRENAEFLVEKLELKVECRGTQEEYLIGVLP